MGEKWNTEIMFRKDSDVNKDNIDSELHENIKFHVRYGDMLEIDELVKSETERSDIEKVNRTLEKLFGKEGLPPILIPIDKIHIVDPKVYEATEGIGKGRPNSQAVTNYGHIYIKDDKDRMEFIHTLTHEIAHDISFLKSEVGVEKKDGDEIIQIYPSKRLGYGVMRNNKPTLGRGLNEAMTELMAIQIRHEFAIQEELTQNEKDELLGHYVYFPQIRVMEELFKLMDQDDPDSAFGAIMYGYSFGDPDGLKRLSETFRNKGMKNGLKILFSMETNKESALETAKKLHLDDAVRDIEEFIKEQEQRAIPDKD